MMVANKQSPRLGVTGVKLREGVEDFGVCGNSQEVLLYVCTYLE